jgi:hypothetical protein
MLAESEQGQPLEILDNCRIRWGRVVEASGDSVVVRSRPLTWDGKRLDLGPPRLETARAGSDGYAFIDGLESGEWVSLHWDWVCDRLTQRQLSDLRRYSAQQLDITNNRVMHPGPGLIIG